MSHTAKWLITDKSDTAYKSVVAFFGTADDTLVKQHTDIEIGLVLDKVNSLSEDGKSIIHAKTFENAEDYNTWLTEKEKLPAIDKHLIYTPI